jgi:hypothetical protein
MFEFVLTLLSLQQTRGKISPPFPHGKPTWNFQKSRENHQELHRFPCFAFIMTLPM